MDESHINKVTVAYGISYAIISLLSAILIIIKESNKATVFAWMQALTGHHWITHGLIDIILFVILGWILIQTRFVKSWDSTSNLLTIIVIGSTIVSGLMIAGYFAFASFQ